MKHILLLLFSLLTIIFISGCQNQITEDRAKELVITANSNDVGKAEIISIEKKENHYIVNWVNEDNLSKGIDKVDFDGNITIIEADVQ